MIAMYATLVSVRGLMVIVSLISTAVRLTTLSLASDSIITLSDWPAYVGVMMCAVVGTTIGSRLRQRMRAEGILRCLYALLILSALTMLDVLDSTVAMTVYFSLLACLAVVLVVLRRVGWAEMKRVVCSCRTGGHGGSDSPEPCHVKM